MAQQIINSDSIRPLAPSNEGLSTEFGDTWDTTVVKINAMFAELYDAIGVSAGSGLVLDDGVLSIATAGVVNSMLANPSINLGSTTLTLGGSYSSIAGNLAFTGTVNFTGSLEIGGTAVGLPVSVPNGGTGVGSLTANGVLYGGGTGNVGAAAVNSGATNKYLQQANGFAPSFAQVAFSDLSGTIAATQLPAGAAEALSAGNDTNVTLTLSGSYSTALLEATTITAGWTGTLAASRLNSNVVQAITDDTNVTGSISAQNLTLGWTGTLAAGRLNSNVVQAVTNDTNVTGSISSQRLTLGWTGTLATSRMPALTGDVTSSSGTVATTVGALQGNPVSSSAPTSGQVLEWNGSAWAPTTSSSALVLRSYLAGYTLSNDSTSPNTVLDIAVGQCADSTNAVYITLASAFTKSTGGSWAAGSGSNGMGNGLTVAASTWYHVFAIVNGGSADVYFDTSITAANAPSGTTAYRRLGSIKTDASSHILKFLQIGDWFDWVTPVVDLSNVSIATTPSTTTLTFASVPPGIECQWYGEITASNNFCLIINPAQTGASASTTGPNIPSGTQVTSIFPNNQQVTASGAASGTGITASTSAYMDRRGRDN